MSLKTLLFISLFAVCVLGAPWFPIMGILGYVGHYCIGPDRQWWNAPLSGLGLRYSFILAVVLAVGVIFNWKTLRYGKKLFCGHEKLVILYVAIIWLSFVMNPATVGRYETQVDHPALKFTKVIIFTLLMTHVVTDIKKLNKLLWVLIVGALVLGMQAYAATNRGRLEGIGGPDFAEANFFAAFVVAILPLIAVKFMTSGWPGKAVCVLAAVFGMNAIVLTRSRGSMVGLAMGAFVAAIMSPKKYRAKIMVVLIMGGAAGIYLADPQFIERISTITSSEGQRDSSAQSRFELWSAAGKMISDKPLGVGAGNIYQNMGKYNRALAKKDVHNTYIRCAAELGLHGAFVLGLIIFNAFRMLLRIRKKAEDLPEEHRHTVIMLGYGMLICLVALLASCMTISLTYVEFLWWFLMLPICLVRAVDNLEADAAEALKLDKFPEESDTPKTVKKPRREKVRGRSWAPLPKAPEQNA